MESDFHTIEYGRIDKGGYIPSSENDRIIIIIIIIRKLIFDNISNGACNNGMKMMISCTKNVI